MRVKGTLVFLILALMLVSPYLAMATAVHSFDCKNCHLSGYSLDQIAGGVGGNVCMQCHGSAVDFVTGDASAQYGNNPAPGDETSHNWAATSTNPAAGAAEPIRALHPGFFNRYGTTVGTVACSRCHDPHGEIETSPKLLPMNAARTAPMTPNDMCLACHKTFGDSVETDHGLLSHPMVVTYNATDLGPDYKSVTDNYDSNNPPVDPYANGIQLVDGGVSCLSCHSQHYTDSNSDTTDGPGITDLGAGDGIMLRGDGTQFYNSSVLDVNGEGVPRGTSFCTTCHNLNPVDSMHGSATGDMGCMGCHGGHNYNNDDPSYYMLVDNYKQLPIEVTGTPGDPTRGDLWGGVEAGIDGFCETCHGDIEDPGFSIVNHNQGDDCATCHLSHGDGAFSDPIGCNTCHGYPPEENTAGGPRGFADSSQDYNGDTFPDGNGYIYAGYNEATTPHLTHAGTTPISSADSKYGYSCDVCHDIHKDTDGFNTNHDQGSFQDVYNGTTHDPRVDFNVAAAYGDPNCTVYCHSDGGPKDGSNNRIVTPTSPSWDGTRDTIVVGGVTDCSACHGDNATLSTNKHAAHLAQGFSCDICHSDTVATGSTDTLLASALGDSGTHVNTTIEVVFDSSAPIKSGGAAIGVRQDSTPFDPATTTCAMYCHSSGTSTKALTYNSITWTGADTALACDACHNIPSASQTAAHQAHVVGSTSFVGHDLDCAVCHDDTMDAVSNLAIADEAFHVNGQVDVKMPVSIDPSLDCSTSLCHSDGNIDSVTDHSATANPKNNSPAWTLADTTPGTFNACDKCHGDDANDKAYPAYADGGAGSTDANSHNKHVGSSNIPCQDCHATTTLDSISVVLDGTHVDQNIDVNSSKVDSWDGTTCSATVCHGGGTPQWGGTVACGSCHAANNTLAQSHPTHYDAVAVGDYTDESNSSTAGNYLIQCGVCHSTNGAGGITHAGGWVRSTAPRLTAEVNFDGTVADATGTYTPGSGETVDNGFYYSDATCANLYCHGDFSGDGSTDNGNSATPTWGGAAACGSCHDVDTTNPTMDGGMHDLHAQTLGVTCDYCHAGTAVNAAGGIDDKSTHVNAQVEWKLDENKNVFTSSSTYNGANIGTIAKANVGDGAYGNCANMYCHSDVQPNGGAGAPTSYYNTASWTTGTDIVCGSCHNVHVSQVTGSHTKHYTTYSIVCANCHATAGAGSAKHGDYAVDVILNTNWGAANSYDGTLVPGDGYGGCSTNVYCHSDGQATPTYNAVTWGDTINDCVSCHEDATAGTSLSGAHEAHVVNATATIGMTLGCIDCHSDTVSDNTTIDITTGFDVHVDKVPTMNVANFGNALAGTSAAACATAQCHSDGNYDSTSGGNGPTYKDPSGDWLTGGYDCASCHGSGANSWPQYSSNQGTGDHNSHVEHMVQAGITCENCHEDTSTVGTSIDGADPVQHVDNTVDVIFNSVGGLTGAWDDGANSCSATYCHNGAGSDPIWGGTVNCGECHAANKTMEAVSAGHGEHYNSATNGDRTVATKVNDTSNYVFQCGTCHSEVPHVDGTTQVVVNSATWGGADAFASDTCDNLYCHSDGSAAAKPFTVANAPVWGTSTMDCDSCHASSNMTTLEHNTHVDSATYNFSCAECHVVTTTDGTTIANKFTHVDTNKDVDWGTRNADGDNYVNKDTDCDNLYCHSNGQNGSAPYTGNDPKKWNADTGTNCNSCHNGVSGIATNAHENHLINNQSQVGTFTYCNTCHMATGGSTSIQTFANHANKLTNVKFDNSKNKDSDLPTYNSVSTTTADGSTKAAGTAVGSCDNVYCHSVGNLDSTYNVATFDATDGFKAVAWDATGLNCADCHGDGDTKAYPVYTSGIAGSDTANSHVKHVGGGTLCSTCHETTTTSITNDPAAMTVVLPGVGGTHLNRVENVSFNSAIVGGGAGYAADKTCSATYCHGSGTPVWGDASLSCDACHSASSALADSHGVHYNSAAVATIINTNNDSVAGTYIFQCGNCHDGTTHAGGEVQAGIQSAEVSLSGAIGTYTPTGTSAGTDRGFSYTAGSCNTNDCHNDGTAAKGAPNYNGATLQWSVTNLPGSCTGCHNNNVTSGSPMDTGAHTKHIKNVANGASKDCQSCHNATVDSDDKTIIDKTVHVNGTLNVAILGTLDGGNSAYAGSCDAVYCHSTGQSTSDGSVATPTYATATWATPTSGDCGTCHDVTEVAGLTSGSHGEHLGATGVNGCADCHTGALDDASAYSSTNHVNQLIDVANTYTLGGAPGNGYGTCSTATCHDDGTGTAAVTPEWGTAGGCASCHASDMTSGSHDTHLLSTINRTAFGCGNCHDSAVKDTTAPDLHLNDLVDVYNSAVGDFAGSYTGGKAKGSAYGSCATTYCHGDTLSYSAADGIDTSPLWDATLGSNANNCDVCHAFPPDGGGSHPSNTDCNACHFHANASNNGFDDVSKHIDGTVQIDGGNNCSDCHAGGAYKDPDSGDHSVHTDADTVLVGKSLVGGDYGTGTWWYEVTYDATGRPQMGCGQCHPDTEATHLNGSVQNDLDPAGETIASPNAKLGSEPGAAYNKLTTGKCSSVYCHSNGDGTFADSPVWDGTGGNAGIDCASCHGNSPTTAAHGLHEVGIHYEELYDDDGVGLMAKSTDDIGAADGAGGNYGAAAAHGNKTLSTTINCFTCHNGTVTDSANSDNSTCITCHAGATGSAITGDELARIQANSSVHLNGAKTVSFADLSGFKSKAQLRDNLSDADDGSNILSDIWNRIIGYKNPAGTSYDQGQAAFSTPVYNSTLVSCSTVVCHNGNAATWTDTSVDCMYCHTSLPK